MDLGPEQRSPAHESVAPLVTVADGKTGAPMDILKKRDVVPWCLSRVDECLAALTRQPGSAKTVVRKLFFQLVRLLLVKRTPQRVEAEAAYQALGLELAQRRQAEEDLPLNPALAYEQYKPRDGTAYLREKLTKDESKDAALLLRQATLDQIVRAMKLP